MKKISLKCLSLILIFLILINFIQLFYVKKEVSALSASYTQYIKSGIGNFPESYQIQLAYLKYLHPNWNFKAYYTGIDWNELISTSAENAEMKNTIHLGKNLDPAGLCKCGRQGDVGYYDASYNMVCYYLDPRNFLGEAMVFEFLDLSNGDGITESVVKSAVLGTYLEKHSGDIVKAAKEAKINPLHIVATIFQELGRGTDIPKAITGTEKGYENCYNFYNYGATDGAGAVERGLAKAKELGWNTPSKALTEGAKTVLANDYISAGQTTKYFYKFDVVGNEILKESMGKKKYNSSYFFAHQYMTNVRDPASQAGSLYDMYADNGILDESLTFMIPVYDNMPATNAQIPTTLTSSDGTLYYINSMKKYGIEFRTSASSSSKSQGNIYKDTIVAVTGTSGQWSKIKIYGATTFNSTAKQWNYDTRTGYVLTSYLAKVGTPMQDYRGQVDMGVDYVPPTVYGKADAKISGTNVIMTPATTAKDLTNKYAGAVLKKKDGTVITLETQLLGTGDTVTTGGKAYTIIKYGDTSGDGKIDSMDMYQIVQYLLGNVKLDANSVLAADVTKDKKIDSMDMYQIIQYLLKKSELNI